MKNGGSVEDLFVKVSALLGSVLPSRATIIAQRLPSTRNPDFPVQHELAARPLPEVHEDISIKTLNVHRVKTLALPVCINLQESLEHGTAFAPL